MGEWEGLWSKGQEAWVHVPAESLVGCVALHKTSTGLRFLLYKI